MAGESPSSVEEDIEIESFKVVIVGDSSVGKTCLMLRLCTGQFPAIVAPTIQAGVREKMIEVDGKLAEV